MSNTIVLKRSSVGGKVPLSANLAYGELAINYQDGTLYYKNTSNTVTTVTSTVAGGVANTIPFINSNGALVSSTLLSQNTANANVTVSGNTITNAVYVTNGLFYANGVPYGPTNTTSSTQPTNPKVGDVWYDSANDVIYRYTLDELNDTYWLDISSTAIADGNGNYAPGNFTVTGTTTTANVITTNGVFWSNGVAYGGGSGGTTYSNANVTAFLTSGANVTVTGNLLPGANVTYNLGSPTQAWSSLYLSGNTINLGGATIKTDATTGAVALIPLPTASNPNPTGVVIGPTGGITTVSTTGGTVTASAIATATTSTPIGTPKVSSIVYPGAETAANTAGGETITLNGSGFASGLSILIGSNTVSVVSVVSASQVTFTAPAISAGTYPLYVINTDGGTGIALPGISYHGTPQWTTAAGSLGSAYSAAGISQTVTATNTDTVSYSLVSGTLPSGATLNSSTGLISGTSPVVGSTTTYNFVIGATDAENQTTNRSFSLTINPDSVTWNSPTSGTVYTEANGVAISSVTLSATAASGQGVVYTANTLPSGLSLSGNTISGTPTTVGNVTTLLTANANVSYATSTSTISWVINVSNDPYFNYTTLLLNGETNTNTYIQDASTNNFALTVSGNATPNRFSPLWGAGYYGVSFDGSTGYLSLSSTSALTLGSSGNFTIELWFYPLTSEVNGTYLFCKDGVASSKFPEYSMVFISGSLLFTTGDASGASSTQNYTMGTPTVNTWNHVAACRVGTTWYLFLNGVLTNSGGTAQTATPVATGAGVTIGNQISGGSGTGLFTGYISNLRIVNGTALYTSSFTPSTSPLTAITNTVLLTCQSANFVDNSTNAFTITPTGTVKIVPNQPFGALPSGVQTYGSGLFDGSTGYLSIPTASGNLGTTWTIECWWKANGSQSNYAIIIGQNFTGSLTSGSWAFKSNNTGQYFAFSWGSGPSNLAGTTNINDGAWHHLAAVNNAGTLTLYVDGVSQASTTGVGSLGSTGAVTYVGYNPRDVVYASGYVSGLRIISGSAVYTTNFTPPTSPLTAITNTSLLTLQYKNGINNNTFYDDSTNNFAITRNGTPTQGTFSPFSQTGWSNYFDGSSGYLPITQSSFTTTGNFTIECWAYIPSAISNYFGLFSMRSYSSGSPGVSINILNTGYFDVGIYSSSNTQGVNYISYTQQAAPIGQWFHVALVRNGTTGNNCSFYLNGTLVASFGPNTSATSTNSGTVSIGTYYISATSGYYFPGYISNLRYVVGSAVYTSNFTPSTTPLTAIANTALLTCQSNRFVDNSTNAYTITPSGTVQVQAFSPFAPGVTYSSSTNGGSMYFNGSSDYLSIPYNPAFNLANYASWTVECWVYLNTSSATCDFISQGATSWRLTVVSGVFTWGFYGSGSNNTQTGSPSVTLSPYQWYHLAVTCDGTGTGNGQVKMYVNGTYVPSSAGGYTPSSDTSNPLYVGVNYNGGSLTWFMNGYIANPRVLGGVALYTGTGSFTIPAAPPTPTKNTNVLFLGTNSGIQDQTAKTDIITFGSAKTQSTTVKYGTGALTFPNTGSTYADYVNVVNANCYFPGNFTVEFWFNPQYTSTSWTDYAAILDLSAATSTDTSWWVIHQVNQTIYFATNAGTPYLQTGNVFTVANTWYHVALVRSGSTITFYINGTSAGTVSYSTAFGSKRTLTVGAQLASYTTRFTRGSIDDLRITPGIARYTTNFTPPGAGSIAY
jgi:Concanavalin A-like lectin/glucanases superfamily